MGDFVSNVLHFLDPFGLRDRILEVLHHLLQQTAPLDDIVGGLSKEFEESFVTWKETEHNVCVPNAEGPFPTAGLMSLLSYIEIEGVFYLMLRLQPYYRIRLFGGTFATNG
ncbi:hypothetical protein YTPLAS18_08140 [Nitrospira sp.]|nr:hypothetical protein YTPLAS18_08140 [Nitrospira sp.]